MMYDGALQVRDCNPGWFGATTIGEHCPLAATPATCWRMSKTPACGVQTGAPTVDPNP